MIFHVSVVFTTEITNSDWITMEVFWLQPIRQ